MCKKINFYNLVILTFLCLFANISRADDCLTKYACLHPMTKGFFAAACRIENGIEAEFIENGSYPGGLDFLPPCLCSSATPCFTNVDPMLFKFVKNTFTKNGLTSYEHTPSDSILTYTAPTGELSYALGTFPDKDEWVIDSATGLPICE